MITHAATYQQVRVRHNSNELSVVRDVEIPRTKPNIFVARTREGFALQ
jgi:hypothetical protein